MAARRPVLVVVLLVAMGCEGSESTGVASEPPAPLVTLPSPPSPPPPPRPEPVDPCGPHGGTICPPPRRVEVVSPLGGNDPDLHMSPQAWLGKLASADRTLVKKVCARRKAQPCERFLGATDHARDLIAQLPADRRAEVETYCGLTTEGRGCQTPLVLSFAPDEPVDFVADRPTASTPWIARDLDGDGAIRDRELFHGFAELAALDANGDGVIDARDPAFAELVLSSSLGQRPLAEVASMLPLANELVPRCNAEGDCEGERASLTLLDGSRGALIDVYMVTQ
jgi:hypothetical protein